MDYTYLAKNLTKTHAKHFFTFLLLFAGTIHAQPGTLDTTFNPVAGFNGTVTSLALQPDGKVLVGGSSTKSMAKTEIALPA